MNSKLIGGVLLIIGNTIGAGMLALPIATAQLGFWGSLIMLIACWMLMTTCTFIFLEVNLWSPPNSNLITMTKMLGLPIQILVCIFYLILQYSILCAYIAGGGDLFHYMLNTGGISISLKSSLLTFTLFFGFIVYCGIKTIDYFNRFLMFGKLGSLVLLIVLIIPFISIFNLNNNEVANVNFPNSFALVTVAFATMLLVPSMRTYFDQDIRTLRKAIFIGTLVPLIIYIAWDMVVLGVVPLDGDVSMRRIITSPKSNSDLIDSIRILLNKEVITTFTTIFTSICMVTSFLSLSLSLSDFWSDGLSIQKQGVGKLLVFSITFIPPLIIVLFYPYIFIQCLQYAGLCCFILMILLPPILVWFGRYHRLMSINYKLLEGKILLISLMIIGLVMTGFGIKNI